MSAQPAYGSGLIMTTAIEDPEPRDSMRSIIETAVNEQRTYDTDTTMEPTQADYILTADVPAFVAEHD